MAVAARSGMTFCRFVERFLLALERDE